MERRDFIQKSALAATAFTTAGLSNVNAKTFQQGKELYEWRVYDLIRGQGALDKFLSNALIPALNKLGVKKVGAFGEIGKSEPQKYTFSSPILLSKII